MKRLLIAASAAAALLTAAPAFAQTAPFGQVYGTLGYSNFGADQNTNFDAFTARLGTRLGAHLGVEGEVSTGLGSDKGSYAGAPASLHLDDQYAAYGVGYLPVLPHADLFARVGYGHSDLHLSTNAPGASGGFGEDSINYGAGGQYFFDHHNGLRAEYTRQDYQCSNCGGADVWSVAYVRKF
jgi:outer membrane immunogenic protein